MKKCNITTENGLQHKNMILLETIDDFYQYLNGNFTVEFKESTEDLVYLIQNKIQHSKHYLSCAAENISNITGQGKFYIINNLKDRLISNQLSIMQGGGKIAINSRGGYFQLSKKDKIHYIDEKQYTESDISITKWQGGKHYYAKIGKITVVDSDGCIKWNTYDYAYAVAKNFLSNLK